ncbi:MAG: TIGR01777 family oxidoreductase [Chitinophagaceae bacterium]|nr:TIGR01777 family oxidoreductase [Chitinophagaceae bacterium]
MPRPRIVIAGGTGFIGNFLINAWSSRHDIVVLTRQQSNQHAQASVRYVSWNPQQDAEWMQVIDGADLLINLTGRSVNCRYTAKNREAILQSRIQATAALGRAIKQAAVPPPCWINASSATIYRHAEDHPQDEYTGETGHDFSMGVCHAWERSFFEQDIPQTRKVALRIGITLGAGSALNTLLRLAKAGLGGRQGSGRQKVTWIHYLDLIGIMYWIWKHPKMEGIFNCCSPNVVSNNNFMQTLRKAAGIPFGMPLPEPLIRMGALLIGTSPELVLKSRWVAPSRLLQSGFIFRYPQLQQALEDIIDTMHLQQKRHTGCYIN